MARQRRRLVRGNQDARRAAHDRRALPRLRARTTTWPADGSRSRPRPGRPGAALVYAPFLVDEPLAYPVATLALFLIARWLARPTWPRLAVATAACLLGPLARTQLSVLLVVLAFGGAVVVWRSERARRLRTGWTTGDWVGAATLALGAVLVGLAFVSRRSTSWYVATTFYKGRMVDFGLWANGALALGLGLVPFLATLAALASVRGRTLTDGERGFAITAAASLASFTVYAAVKGATSRRRSRASCRSGTSST